MDIEQPIATETQANDHLPSEASNTSNVDDNPSLSLVPVRPPTPDKCAVCLNNKQNDIIARIDSCSHTFCFDCIFEWSKVRSICPLCKQAFNIITRERYSGDIIEEIHVSTPATRPVPIRFANLNEILVWFDRTRQRPEMPIDDQPISLFRQMVYMEWLNSIEALVRRPNRPTSAGANSNQSQSRSLTTTWSNVTSRDSIRRLLHRYLRQTTNELRQSTIYSQSTRQTVAFRKFIYLNRLFVRSPIFGHDEDTLTLRESSPQWYTSNPACLHRLVPFLARELLALLWNDEATIEQLIQEILANIQTHPIQSATMTRRMNEYLGRYTKHFLHEFHTFARCPYDLAGFDRNAHYSRPDLRPPRESVAQISIDDDDDDDAGDGDHDTEDETAPIIIDETSDQIDLTSSAEASGSSENRSSSPECEIVEYVEAPRPQSPTLIILSEDDEQTDEASSSRKRRREHRQTRKRSRNSQQRTTVSIDSSPDSILLDEEQSSYGYT